MNPDLKDSLYLLLPSVPFKAFMAAINKQRESAIFDLTSQGVIQNPQALAAAAGEIRAYDQIRSMWEQLENEAVGAD